MSHWQTSRIRLISGAILCCAFILVTRLYYLQVMHSSLYRDKADRQYVKQGDSVFDRGTIFFQTKDGALVSGATLKLGFTVAVSPKTVSHPEDVLNVISGIIPLDEKATLDRISKTNDPYEEIAKCVNPEIAKRIEDVKLAGVSVYKERWRYYPGNTLASHVLGLVSYKDSAGTVQTGTYGLESFYNDTLSRDGTGAYKNFFAEIFLNVSEALKGKSPEGNIVTTIEPTVQGELEKALVSIEDAWKSDISGGIVMDPTTGEIYAMAANPTFDPNNYNLVKNQKVFANPLVQNQYEMGSIIKPLAMASALDTGVLNAKTTYVDKGSIIVDGLKISNFDGKSRGLIDMQHVLNESLNVGMVFVASKLGHKALADYYTRLGFGEETGIDLPGEIRGKIANLNSPRDVEYATAAFGQGIAMTPIETVRALSALGNGGTLPNPHIVKRIDYTTGLSKTLSYPDGPRIFKPETSEEITRMLVTVADDALLGGTVKMPRYTFAAKTGTAQMAKEDGKGYYSDRYLHSFFGYFPAYKPKFIVFLFTVYPKNATYASHTLTSPFISLTKFLINYYNIPPDR